MELGLFRVLGNVVDRLSYGANFFSLVIRDGDVELLFELHDEFYSVQRIRSQIVGEACRQVYFSCINSQLIDDDRRDFS